MMADELMDTKVTGQELRLPKLLSDGCVLQQGQGARLWGWAVPGSQVTVSLGLFEPGPESMMASAQSVQAETVTDSDGTWSLILGPLQAGGPYRLTVQAQAGTVAGQAVTDSGQSAAAQSLTRSVYVGEVLLCSGQSNMELPMSWVRGRFREEFNRQPDPALRQYKVELAYSFEQTYADHEDARWTGCAPDTLGDFSALAYFAGRRLRQELGVPIGLLNVSLGGSPIESWLDADSLAAYPELLAALDPYRPTDGQSMGQLAQAKSQASLKAIADWYAQLHWDLRDAQTLAAIEVELSQAGKGQSVAAGSPVATTPATSQSNQVEDADPAWFPLSVPFSFKPAGLPAYAGQPGLEDFNGLLQLRRTLVLPAEAAGQPAQLHLGTLVDADRVYVNGTKIGQSEYQYLQRDYQIPAGLLKAGDNQILVSLVCERGTGRWTPGKPICLIVNNHRYGLDGAWQARVATRLDQPCPVEDFIRWRPTVLYKAMLAPCFPMTLRAALWYQGESNADRPDRYAGLLTQLISLWRDKFEQPDLPFFIVQLPGFSIDSTSDEVGWAAFRQAQAQVEQLAAGVTVVPTLDAGEWNDLHPQDKRTVGLRMADALLGTVYSRPWAWQPPTCTGLTVQLTAEGIKQLVLSFNTDLRTLDGHEPGEFSLVWLGTRPVPALAQLQRSTVVVDLPPAIEQLPSQVRYAWRDAPSLGLLCDVQGFPVAPFEQSVE